jgi:hypothetical protein
VSARFNSLLFPSQVVGYGVNGLGDINDEFSIELVGGEDGDRIRPVVVRLLERVLNLNLFPPSPPLSYHPVLSVIHSQNRHLTSTFERRT